MRSPVRIWIAAPAQNTLKPSRLRGVFYFTLSVSLRSPAPPKGEPLAGRAALSGTPEVRYGAKGRALLQRSAASGQALIVKLPWISVAGRYRSRQAKLFSFSVGLTDTPVPLPLGEVSPKVTERATRPWHEAPERANKNRAVGNVRTYGAVYLLEEIVLVENGFLSQFSKIVPIKIAYLRYAVCGCCLCIINANRYKSRRDYKDGILHLAQKIRPSGKNDRKYKKPPEPQGFKWFFLNGAAIQIRTGDLILTKDALYQLSYSSKWRPGSGSNRRPPA